MNHSIKLSSLALALLLSNVETNAQATGAVTDADNDFKLARDLYQKGQVSVAYPLFKNLGYNKSETMQKAALLPANTTIESQYYSVICGLQMDDAAAEQDALAFMAHQYSSPHLEFVHFYLGENYFRHEKYTEAIAQYKQTTIANLSNEQIADLKFHQGYCYFIQKDFEKAKPAFDAIRQIPSNPNYINANYYYGFIALADKNYSEALNAFEKVENNPKYETIVPYYIMQIYYLQGDKEKAIAYGNAALKKNGQYYAKDMQLLIGHAYFDKEEFAQALPYLEAYVSNTENASREDIYELSYCYYNAKNWKKAITGLKKLSGKEDALSQNSMYLLGDCYLNTGEKANARNAFLFCSLNSSEPVQREISTFNYAKLSYELDYQNIALTELRKFVSQYPHSAYITEAQELMASILGNTNNYQEGIALIDKIGLKSAIVQKVYPRVLYGRAVELINDQRLNEADALLDKALTVPYNENVLPAIHFWKGEIAYRNGQYDAAVRSLYQYTLYPVTIGDVNPGNAQYDLGYAYLKSQQYSKAATAFQKVIPAKITPAATDMQQDAYLRLADAYYAQKQYSKALQLYSNAIDNNLQESDYSYYQQAMIAGAQGKSSKKADILNEFNKRYGNSAIAIDANMELANTYMAQEKFEQAIAPLNSLIGNSKAGSLRPRVLLNLGVCQYNLNDNDAALIAFQQLISQYPNAEETEDATDYVKSIFVSQGKASGYVDFMRKNGKNVRYTEADSLTYNTALGAYSNGNYAKAKPLLDDYIQQYPDGQFSVEAHYNIARIYLNDKDSINALTNYSYVADKAPNKYAEEAALQVARINYFENKDYSIAAKYYKQLKDITASPDNKLESMRGLLRCQYKLELWSDAYTNAQDLLNQTSIASDDKQMANMVIAKNQQINEEPEEAVRSYKIVYGLQKSSYGAEARYRVAEILYGQNKLPEAEKAAFEVINKAGSYDYWITKSYILLGDIYLKQKDYFNAEATLKSVAENASDTGLRTEAQKHLNNVLEAKAQKN